MQTVEFRGSPRDYVAMIGRCLFVGVLVAVVPLVSGCWLTHQRALGDAGATSIDAGPSDASARDVGIDAREARRDGGPACAPRGELVRLPGPPAFAMEATEVTQADYARFLACEPSPPVVPPCSVADVTPDVTFDPAARPDHPVQGVSFCAAASYCAWAGRRLCTLGEWEPVCARVRDAVAPRDFVISPRACVLSAYADGEWSQGPLDGTARVREASGCRASEAPYDALYDVIGNVEQWVWDGSSPQSVGNAFSSGPRQPCAVEGAWGLEEAFEGMGIRCCAD